MLCNKEELSRYIEKAGTGLAWDDAAAGATHTAQSLTQPCARRPPSFPQALRPTHRRRHCLKLPSRNSTATPAYTQSLPVPLLPRIQPTHHTLASPPPTPTPQPATMSDESKGTESGKVVHLVSQEGDQYEVEVAVCKMSELVKTMLPDGTCARREDKGVCVNEGGARRGGRREWGGQRTWPTQKGQTVPSRSSLGAARTMHILLPPPISLTLKQTHHSHNSLSSSRSTPSLPLQTTTAPTPRRSPCPTSRTACWPR